MTRISIPGMGTKAEGIGGYSRDDCFTNTISLGWESVFGEKKALSSLRLFNIRPGQSWRRSVNILSPSVDCGRLHASVKARRPTPAGPRTYTSAQEPYTWAACG